MGQWDRPPHLQPDAPGLVLSQPPPLTREEGNVGTAQGLRGGAEEGELSPPGRTALLRLLLPVSSRGICVRLFVKRGGGSFDLASWWTRLTSTSHPSP